MVSSTEIENLSDPSWNRAKKVVKSTVQVPAQIWQLLRSSWNNLPVEKATIDYLANSSVGAGFLFDAGQPNVLGTLENVVSAEQALVALGPKMTATVLAVNYNCRTTLRYRPQIAWEKLLKEMATMMHVGALFGERIPAIGREGGVAVGFAKSAAYGYLLVNFPREFKKYWFSGGQTKSTRQMELDTFGCEASQIAAFILQQFGFGTALSMGVAVGIAHIEETKHTRFTPEMQRWRAAFYWIEALRLGRNYPGKDSMREYFPELRPGQGGKNTLLEVLYTQISAVQKNGSDWTWHLPRPSYEETQRYIQERAGASSD